jgi:hypothetical protein
MSDQEPRKIIPAEGNFIQSLLLRLRLTIRLLGDARISPFLKLIPFGALLYLIIPEPIVGPIDDATVLGISFYLFLELCPPEIVQEHMDALTNVVSGTWRDAGEFDEDIIDAEFEEKD